MAKKPTEIKMSRMSDCEEALKESYLEAIENDPEHFVLLTYQDGDWIMYHYLTEEIDSRYINHTISDIVREELSIYDHFYD